MAMSRTSQYVKWSLLEGSIQAKLTNHIDKWAPSDNENLTAENVSVVISEVFRSHNYVTCAPAVDVT